MPTEPTIVGRAAQPYAGIGASVSMDGFGDVIEAAIPEVFARLDALGVAPDGPPLVRYAAIDMEGRIEIEIGVPVAGAIEDDGRVRPGLLPAGRYATLIHVGHPDGLLGANEALQVWAHDKGLRVAMSIAGGVDRFESRFESYRTDPAAEPDPERWETEIAYLLATTREETQR